jgi:hypothetical protein
VAAAQEVRQPSDWKKMYEDASAQLRAAQDRKAEMAKEIAVKDATINDLQNKLTAAQSQMQNLLQQIDILREDALRLGSVYAGWESPAASRPAVEPWRAFGGLETRTFAGNYPPVFDPRWPLAAP